MRPPSPRTMPMNVAMAPAAPPESSSAAISAPGSKSCLLDANLAHPPVTGGKNAISSPGRSDRVEVRMLLVDRDADQRRIAKRLLISAAALAQEIHQR